MEKAMKHALIGIIVVTLAFMAGRYSKRCSAISPQLLEALTERVREKEKEIENWRTLADAYKAKADSIAAIPKPHVETVLPRVPAGRNDASLDSIGAIIFAPW